MWLITNLLNIDAIKLSAQIGYIALDLTVITASILTVIAISFKNAKIGIYAAIFSVLSIISYIPGLMYDYYYIYTPLWQMASYIIFASLVTFNSIWCIYFIVKMKYNKT
ncbi:hypothetical protein AVI51_10435 [Piscirickettsia salmonis]|uniref:Uncharacterized protein n=1 Tax=Piscirickettsia salmonis TaxID=1238 RepID=A0A9Q5YGL7_PISSA|nr:hypothetical protein [Piscirickettsia salmonis]ERL61006.1 putative membrane protein [Piscirickettsia salmonis LF-89 = ATCC VR-1361]ALA23521.1 membrane protein [Piscirickettsia salmonis]APS43975.1 hypothetical protein AVI48_06080 [Piscirickettsia salmonis]APS47332.1 hypothetical protein AVI49_06685 [Piscirickettsia salmonis]APS51230.1 hypothetical protein AVI50_10540 [Piscirickettsia salmonis]